jgi:tRNA A-37 threonylcarbamoyl transferase component Bud32
MSTRLGFEWLQSGTTRMAVAPAYLDELRSLKLHEPGGLELLLGSRAASHHGGGRAGGWQIALPESRRRIHLRPIAHGGLLRGLTGRRLLGLRRPLRELAGTALLRDRGVPVPEPVAVLATRRGLFWKACLATAFEEKCASGSAVLRSGSRKTCAIEACRAAGRAIRTFHDAGGRHSDLHVDNLLVRAAPDPPRAQVVVIDLDRVRIDLVVPPRRRMADLMRLYRSLRKHRLLGRDADRVCAAFLGAYCAGNRALRAALLANLRPEQRRIAMHALAYRQGR